MSRVGDRAWGPAVSFADFSAWERAYLSGMYDEFALIFSKIWRKN